MTYRLPTAKLIFFLGLAGFIAVSILASRAVLAQNSTGATGIQVSAPVYNFQIDPGDSAQEIIKIRNVSDTDQTYFPEVLDFKPIGETGTPQFITGIEKQSYSYSLANWVKISEEPIKLAPNESAALNFTIDVPKSAEPGGAYAGILFGTSPPKTEGSTIAISNKVGALVLVRVAGDAKETATLKEFSTNGNFFENPPVDFVVRVENKGTVHVRPKGTIEITDTFGKKVATLEVNEKDGAILPESIRKFDKDNDELAWNPGGFTLGRYTATLTLNYGNPAQQIISEVSYWVVPWKVLLVIGVGILILILLLILIIKRYNHWIVAKAEKTDSKKDKPSPARDDPHSETGEPASSSEQENEKT